MSEIHRKLSTLPLIIVLLVAMLVAYPLSVGPAAWIVNSGWCPPWLGDMLVAVYWPLEWLADRGPNWLHDAVYAYAGWWAGRSVPATSL